MTNELDQPRDHEQRHGNGHRGLGDADDRRAEVDGTQRDED